MSDPNHLPELGDDVPVAIAPAIKGMPGDQEGLGNAGDRVPAKGGMADAGQIPAADTQPATDAHANAEAHAAVDGGGTYAAVVKGEAPAAPQAQEAGSGPGQGMPEPARDLRGATETRATLDDFAAGNLEAATVHGPEQEAPPPPSYREQVQDNLAT